MGSLLCKAEVKEDLTAAEASRRRVRRKLTPAMPANTAAVLGDFDLLQQVLSKLVPESGCSLEVRLRVAQVSRLWREVSKTMPVCLEFTKPLSNKAAEHLKAGQISGIRRLVFAGISEERGHEVLGSLEFQRTSRSSLRELAGLALKTDLACLQQFPELRALSLCRCKWATIMDLVRGKRYNLDSLAGCQNLQTLTLKELAGAYAAVDLSNLPPCLRHLHLINCSFVHHPEMQLPEALHLDSLSAVSGSRQCTVIPVELLRRTRRAVLMGKQVFLSGPPIDHPEMTEDAMEVIISHNTLLLLGYGMAAVLHESRPSAILRSLESSDLQGLRIRAEEGGAIHLVSRSDCCKGLRWKSLEPAECPMFAQEATSPQVLKSSAFLANAEERNADGSVCCISLFRKGAPSGPASSLDLLQNQAKDQVKGLQDESLVRLDQALDELVWRP